MITYHLNPAFKGNIKINGRFEANEIPAESPSLFKVLQWQFMANPPRKEKKQDTFKVPVISNETFMHEEENMMVRKLLGNIDICIMSVGAYKPPFMMKEPHMNPTEAIQAFHDPGGKVFIPMPYDLSDEPLGEPLNILENMEKSEKIDGKLKALAIGQIFYLSESAVNVGQLPILSC